jgi:tyrosine-protein kinase Etk/Wzc
MNNTGSIITIEDLRPAYKYLKKNWLVLLVFPILAYTLAYLYTYRLPDIHGAKSEILLKSDETYNYQSEIRSNFGYLSQYADIENQKRIITSYDLIDKTVERLHLNVGYFIQGRWKRKKVPSFPALVISVDWEKMEGTLNTPIKLEILDYKSVRLEYELNGTTQSFIYPLGGDMKDHDANLGNLTILPTSLLDITTQGQFIDYDYYLTVSSDKELISSFRNSLEVINVDFTSILELAVNNEVPSYAKMFLDTLSVVYIEYSLEKQYHVNENTQKYIEKQLVELESIMDSLEYAIELYKGTKNIIDINKEQDFLFENYLALEKEKTSLLNITNSYSELLKFVTDTSMTGNIPPSFYLYSNDVFLSTQVSNLHDERASREEMLNDFKTAAYSVLTKDSLIQVKQARVETYIKNSQRALKEDLGSIERKLENLSGSLNNLPQSQRALLEIDRKLKVNESLYVYLLESKASTVIAKAAILPEIRVIENARSIGRTGPNKSKTIYVAAGVSLILAVLIGLLRTSFFERIESLNELKSITKLSVLGIIPYYDQIEGQPIAVLENSRSNITESLRTLRTNLQYLLTKRGGNVILISSLHPSEGKTFVSTNLASILAKAGKKVALIDFDLHKPKVHKTFKLPNSVGVSGILTNRRQVEECIISSVIENLDIITAGPIPPNASELMLSEKTAELVRELKNNYEYVILDTPPLILINDSLVLHKLVDNSIFVLNTEKASKHGIKYLEESLQQNDITNVSLILNNIKTSKWKKTYSYYADKYGYGYRYGYGSNYGSGEYYQTPKASKKKRT